MSEADANPHNSKKSLSYVELIKKIPPFEFTLQSRQLRNRVLASQDIVQDAATDIANYAKQIISRRHTYRKDHIKSIIHRWQVEVPDQFRLGLVIEPKKHGVYIADVRVVGSEFRTNKWATDDEKEKSLSIYILSLVCEEGVAKSKIQVLGTISLYALARYYQYTFDHTDQSLCISLSNIALQFDKLSKLKDWRCSCDNGIWVGKTVAGHTTGGRQDRILATRTFHQN